MNHMVDVTELSLLELFRLRDEALLGQIEMDEQNFLLLCVYAGMRTAEVTMLEVSLAADDAPGTGS